jgi:transcriptional regulator with XRE-family HTH domain
MAIDTPDGPSLPHRGPEFRARRFFDQRRALGLSAAELAARAELTVDDVECIEEGGTEPTIALLRRLASALDSDVRLTTGHDLGSVWFEPHAA